MLFNLAIRNVLRQRGRSVVTLLAIVTGVASLVVVGGFIEDVYVQFGESIIQSQTGHIQVFKQGFVTHGKRNPEQFLLDDANQLAEQIAQIPGVAFATQRLNFSGLANNGKRDLPVVGEGVEPAKETSIRGYLRIIAGRHLEQSDMYAITVGEGVSNSLGVGVGSVLNIVVSTIGGAINTIDFNVVGVFQSYSKDFDAHAIRIPLAASKQLLSAEGANLLVAGIHRTPEAEAVRDAIISRLSRADLDAKTWRQLSDFYDKTVKLYERQFGVLKFIIFSMVCLSVINSLNMTIFERTGEFGTLRAMGSRPLNIIQLIVVECVLLGLIGTAAGVLAGIAASDLLSWIGISMPPAPNSNIGYTARIQWNSSILVMAATVGLSAAIISSIVPSWRAAHIPIVDALRENI